MGLYTIILFFTEIILLVLALIKHQKFALLIFLTGVSILALLAMTICFQISFPYDKLNINLYLAFIISVMLIVAGFVGILTNVQHKPPKN